MMDALRTRLVEGVGQLGLSLSNAMLDQLLAYMQLIQKWTRVYNLTAVRDADEMLTHHILDSLAVVGPLRKQMGSLRAEIEPFNARILDVGAGAGLPGVVLAICEPEWTVHCVDAVAKKAAFVQQVAAELSLRNLRGIHSRVESLRDVYPVVCSRAFASLADFTKGSRTSLANDGIWMAMKGRQPVDELAALPAEVEVFHVEPLVVPALDAERCVVWMRKRRPVEGAVAHSNTPHIT